ncbi:hypothetical protein ERJ75_001715200 [Trypanosoma vivax]|nr:hypothetical protein ERJ75_001715200 [Trypanosoma vivax]
MHSHSKHCKQLRRSRRGRHTAMGLLLATHWTAHQAASNSNGQTHTRRRHRKTEKRGRAERNVAALQAAKGNAPTNTTRATVKQKARTEAPEAQQLCGDENRNMRLAIAKKVMAEDASDEAHRAQRAARIEQEARTQENANTQKDAAQAAQQRNRTSREDTRDQHRRHAQQRARAQRKTAVAGNKHAAQQRLLSRSCGARNRKHARMRNGTSQQPSQQAMSTRLSAKQKRATREGRQSDTVHSSNAK